MSSLIRLSFLAAVISVVAICHAEPPFTGNVVTCQLTYDTCTDSCAEPGPPSLACLKGCRDKFNECAGSPVHTPHFEPV